MSLKVHQSALRHGLGAKDVRYAALNATWFGEPDDDVPQKQLRLGFDTVGRLLELFVLRFDSGNELVIHAMKARKQYRSLLDR